MSIKFKQLFTAAIILLLVMGFGMTVHAEKSGGAGEFHPHAPTDPNVTVSRHSALIIQPPG